MKNPVEDIRFTVDEINWWEFLSMHVGLTFSAETKLLCALKTNTSAYICEDEWNRYLRSSLSENRIHSKDSAF